MEELVDTADAGKITVMLLKMNNSSLLMLLKSPEELKSSIKASFGRQLYSLVEALVGDTADTGKITAMALENEDSALFELLESPEKLNFYVVEATRVLKAAAVTEETSAATTEGPAERTTEAAAEEPAADTIQALAASVRDESAVGDVSTQVDR